MDIKTRAIEYFSNNNILKELENALQLMFQENASDHSGYLVTTVESLTFYRANISKRFPLLRKLSASKWTETIHILAPFPVL